MDGWFIYHGMNDPVGPVSTESIIDAIRSGKFPLDANVCRPGDRKWVPVITVPEFAAVVREVAPKPAINSLPPPSLSPPPQTAEPQSQESQTVAQVSKWSVMVADAAPVGPYNTEQMVEKILSGEVPLDAQIMRADNNEWVTLRQIPLFALAARVVRARQNPEPNPS
ncbi:MAG: DUF4339 domain-containing protein [Deltaproteobacteria bacterium]|nr:DUF4339 domain-containing protein [Deltaproteobacteria bacterium]